MLRQFLIAKIHRAVVTARDIHYVGSITIDPEVMKAVGILTWERVQVVDVDNGSRFETYAIPGEPGKGQIQLNGAAAHLVEIGHRVIIMAYGWLNEDEIASLCPRVALMDEHNHVSEVRVLEPSPE
jgi:aspartate 1-decarboxylase